MFAGREISIVDISFIVLVLLRGMLSLFVQRRPDVYQNGKMVD